MINTTMLDALPDDELRGVIEQSQLLLKKRDEDRKAKAVLDARAILAAAGLSLKDLSGSGKKKAGKGPVYHGGHSYQHPTDKTLVWLAKGKKPGWLVELEASGVSPVELAGENDNGQLATKRSA
jgi:hypothetical protein